MTNPAPALYIAAASAVEAVSDGAPKKRIHLMPIGTVELRDGRGPFFLASKEAAHAVIEETRRRAGRQDIMIDYDHQSFYGAVEGVGGQAPAAGWISARFYVAAQGSGNLQYIGVAALDAAGNNLVSDNGSYHYTAGWWFNLTPGFYEYVGYFRGRAATGAGNNVGGYAPDPAAAAPWALVLTVDLGGDASIDSAALLYNSAAYPSTVTIHSRSYAAGPFGGPFDNAGADAWGSWQMYPVGHLTADYTHSLALRPAAITACYVRLTIYAPAYATGMPDRFRCGAIAIGKRWQPADGHDWGAQRGVIDQSVSRILQDGGRALEEGARLSTFRASYSGLTDSEKADLWGLLKAAGIGAPFVLVEDPALTPGLIERTHYGTLTRINPIERTMPEKSRFELEFTEWL